MRIIMCLRSGMIASRPGTGTMVRVMILALGLACAGMHTGLGAAEPDELKPGMSEDAVFNVFTMHQSCKNTPLESEGDSLAWSGIFDGEEGRISVHFEGGLVKEIRYRFEAAPEGAEAAFRRLLEKLAIRYGQPGQKDEKQAVWSTPAFRVTAMMHSEEGMISVLLAH